MSRHPKKARDPVAPHPPLRRYYPDESSRREFVDDLFDSGAEHYEWINRVMSLGSGSRYRRDALLRAGIGPGMTVLDVCAGSGQVSRVAAELVRPGGEVVAMDASVEMLSEARKYVDIPQTAGLVEALPFVDNFADAVTMGYALRHVADLRHTFEEFRRVLKPGGTLLMIEFSRPRSRAMYLLLRAYLGAVVPAVARIKGRDAARMMRYFWDTIDSCLSPEMILEVLGEAGFVEPKKSGQIELFAEYSATKPA